MEHYFDIRTHQYAVPRFLPTLQISSANALIEFATYDARLIAYDFLRNVLTHVYADIAVLTFHPHEQRSLALKLLHGSDVLARKFMSLRLKHTRRVLESQRARPIPSSEVRFLTKRLGAECRTASQALQAALANDPQGQDLAKECFDALSFAQDFEDTFSEMDLVKVERSILFRAWSGLYCQTVRIALERYVTVAKGWPELSGTLHQDFVETWSA